MPLTLLTIHLPKVSPSEVILREDPWVQPVVSRPRAACRQPAPVPYPDPADLREVLAAPDHLRYLASSPLQKEEPEPPVRCQDNSGPRWLWGPPQGFVGHVHPVSFRARPTAVVPRLEVLLRALNQLPELPLGGQGHPCSVTCCLLKVQEAESSPDMTDGAGVYKHHQPR